MAVRQEYLDYVLEQFSEFGEVEAKKMFGGIGFFREGMMFGMIGSDVFRLKVDDDNRADYEERGMEQMVFNNKKSTMPYWSVPAEVLEDRTLLAAWAEKAFAAALRAKKKKK